MSASQPTTRSASNPRGRTVTIILLIVLVFMIVKDLFARRRGTAS